MNALVTRGGKKKEQCTLFTKWPNVLQWLKQYCSEHHENKAAYTLMTRLTVQTIQRLASILSYGQRHAFNSNNPAMGGGGGGDLGPHPHWREILFPFKSNAMRICPKRNFQIILTPRPLKIRPAMASSSCWDKKGKNKQTLNLMASV